VTRALGIVLGLALTVAATPSRAADHDEPVAETAGAEEFDSPDLPEVVVESPSLETFPARVAVDGLAHLRLHPGHDLLDVTETARTRPARDAD
jgi:hypothetical protein